MSLFIGTLYHGGLCLFPHMRAMMRLQEDLLASMNHQFDFIYNESLVQRGRNTLVQTFMAHSFERFMFIDGDIEFTSDDVAKLWNLDTDVAVGAYCRKKKDAGLTVWKDGKQQLASKFSLPTEVDYAGTGFMMIKRDVFTHLAEAYPETKAENDKGEYYCHFQVPVHDGVELSEDYDFCRKWRKIGGKVIWDPSISLTHWGWYGY